MDSLVLASRNAHKREELQALIPTMELKDLNQLGIIEELPETGNTFNANAQQKAERVTQLTGLPAISDDSGLVVEALNGEPGVHSAHYSGRRDDLANTQKVLKLLANSPNRKAYFICVICLSRPHKPPLFFEGKVIGKIDISPSGLGGFGYDPIFIPEGYSQSFAVLGAEIKNQLSHRAKAVWQLNEWLKTNPL